MAIRIQENILKFYIAIYNSQLQREFKHFQITATMSKKHWMHFKIKKMKFPLFNLTPQCLPYKGRILKCLWRKTFETLVNSQKLMHQVLKIEAQNMSFAYRNSWLLTTTEVILKTFFSFRTLSKSCFTVSKQGQLNKSTTQTLIKFTINEVCWHIQPFDKIKN